MAKTLVIVESPAKARTIERILKQGYEVLASYGHVRDLPESADEIPDEIRKKKWGRLGVDTEGNFTPYYVIPNDKKKYVQALRQSSDVMLHAVERLVQRQTELWARTVAEADGRRAEAADRQQVLLTQALETAMERTLESHARRLAAQENQLTKQAGALIDKITGLAATVRETSHEQHAALAKISDGIGSQLHALTQLQESENQLRRMQETLEQNLARLAGAGAFEEALHSLTAAIHLLTARSATPAAGTGGRQGPRLGAAA